MFGLIKNLPWTGGNKRTATTILRRFLELNGFQKNWTIAEQIELVLKVESDAWKIDEIENWLRSKVKKNDLGIVLKKKLAKVINVWREEKIKLAPPNSQQQIVDCFHSLKKVPSKDVLKFYAICGGMTDYAMDNSLLSVWTLDEIAKKNTIVSDLICFADFLIESHRYAFKYENENVSSIYSDCESPEFIKIADSLEQFFDLYLMNPNEIYLYKE